MTKKLIVTEKQLQIITQHINESNDTLNKLLSEGIIEEGFKDIALGLLMLAGATLTGQNKAIAQKALENQEIVQKIDATLSDTSELNKVINRIDSKMPNAGQMIQQNADKIKSTISYINDKNAKKPKVGQSVVYSKTSSPSVLRTRLKQGYALSDVKITRDTILPPKTIVTVQDTIDFKWSSDNFFESGTFQMNQNSSDSISTVVNEINAQGGRIIGVYIESSTDKEPIRMGNTKLAQLRANSVEQFMQTLNIGEAKFEVTTSPDSGPEIYVAGMSKEDRLDARIKTAPYRFVNIRLIVVFDEEVKKGETAPQVIERHRYELVKVNTLIYKKVKIRYKKGKNKTSCKKIKTKNKKRGVSTTSCEMFGGSGLSWAQ